MNNKPYISIFTAIFFIIASCKEKDYSKLKSSKSDSIKINVLLHGDYGKEPCVTGADSARAEARNGLYTYVIPGTVYSTEFIKFYRKYLKENYRVKLIANCDGPPIQLTKLDCFFSQANIEVELKYGKQFIERTKKEAKKLFKGTLEKGE